MQVLEQEPNNLKAFHRTGQAFFGMGEWDKALDSFARVLKLEPNNADASQWSVKCMAKKTEQAEKERLHNQKMAERLKGAMLGNA